MAEVGSPTMAHPLAIDYIIFVCIHIREEARLSIKDHLPLILVKIHSQIAASQARILKIRPGFIIVKMHTINI